MDVKPQPPPPPTLQNCLVTSMGQAIMAAVRHVGIEQRHKGRLSFCTYNGTGGFGFHLLPVHYFSFSTLAIQYHHNIMAVVRLYYIIDITNSAVERHRSLRIMAVV